MRLLNLRNTAAAIAAAAACGASPLAAQDGCGGQLNDPHPLGAFDFDTNSNMVPTEKVDPPIPLQATFPFAVVPCVRNNKSNALRVRWIIPDVSGWVPAHVTKYWLPRLHVNDRLAPMKGCLEYGNRGDTTRAAFWGADEDKALIEVETFSGCRATATRYQGQGPVVKGGLFDKFQIPFRDFFPSDGANPDKTMIKIDGRVGIYREGTGSIIALEYTAARYGEGSSGVVGDIALQPSDNFPRELLSAFREQNERQVRLQDQGIVTMFVRDTGVSTFTYASYDVLDRNSQIVGSLAFPVLIHPPR